MYLYVPPVDKSAETMASPVQSKVSYSSKLTLSSPSQTNLNEYSVPFGDRELEHTPIGYLIEKCKMYSTYFPDIYNVNIDTYGLPADISSVIFRGVAC